MQYYHQVSEHKFLHLPNTPLSLSAHPSQFTSTYTYVSKIKSFSSSAANWSEKLITINLRVTIFNLWLILIFILARLAKLSDVCGLFLLMDHVKCLKNQVRSVDSHISLFSVVTNLLWMAEKWAMMKCDSADFSLYVWNKLFSINFLGDQTWSHSNDCNSASNWARETNFFLKERARLILAL